MGLLGTSDEAADTVRLVTDEGSEIIQTGMKETGSVWRSLGKSALGTTGVATGGWLGTTYLDNRSDVKESEATSDAAESYEQAVREIQNDDSLSPEQKLDALSQLNDYYSDLTGGGGGWFDKLGFSGMLVLGMVVLGALKIGAGVLSNHGA